MTMIMQASNQWATRPPDQRFWDLDELGQAVRDIRVNSAMGHCPEDKLRVEASGNDLQLVGSTGTTAAMSHWGFGQLCTRAQFPANPLRTLPATLAAQVLNNRLKAHARPDQNARLLIYRNGGYLVRSVATEMFSPIWNVDIVDRLQALGGNWGPAPAYPTHQEGERTRIATAADAARSMTIREGDTIAPAGLYASPEDMFVFLTDPDKVVRDGTHEGLQRGFIVQNAEVSGKLSFRVMTFFMRGVCGNHIIWNASGLTEIKLKHVGSAPDRAFHRLAVTVRRYADSSATEDEARIQAAQTREIAGTKDEVLDAIFKRTVLSRKAVAASYQLAEENPVDGNPRTHWGMAQGITRYSQTLPNADDRTAVDLVAGKVLDMAF